MIILNIKEIILKDLRESLYNKTILIVIILPIIASLFFTIISQPQIEKKFKVGIIETEEQGLTVYFSDRIQNFQSFIYTDINKGIKDIKSAKIDCLIICKKHDDYTVYIDRKDPVTYLFLKDSIEDILMSYLHIKPDINLKIISLNNLKLRTSFLPIWITITMTMIGILVISGNLAEEKDNRTLAALLITPINESDIIIGKALFGLFLSFITVIIMCVLNGVIPKNLLNLLSFTWLIVSASICFTSIGLIIGVLAESQSAARSLGTIIYFPLLFPALIYNLSEFTRKLAGFFPSYYLYIGIEKIMYYNHTGLEMIILPLYSMFLFTVAYIIFKRMIRHNEL